MSKKRVGNIPVVVIDSSDEEDAPGHHQDQAKTAMSRPNSTRATSKYNGPTPTTSKPRLATKQARQFAPRGVRIDHK